jgi:hypothetical protein
MKTHLDVGYGWALTFGKEPLWATRTHISRVPKNKPGEGEAALYPLPSFSRNAPSTDQEIDQGP